MEKLFEKFHKKIVYISLDFIRGIYDEIHWDARMIGIKGARGIGKTTLLLQYIKKNFELNEQVLYVSLDDIWFSENKLVDLAEQFVKHGGKYLFLDEVHKYENWSVELKNIYDDHPELKIVFTGSSLLEILNARADLSRRAIIYKIQGLSFREFLNYLLNKNYQTIALKDILENHTKLSGEILAEIKPLQYFSQYLKSGYYPYFKEIPDLYHTRLEEVINMVLQVELPLTRGIDVAYVNKLKQLLMVIAESAPFVPNINKLSERIMINRNTLVAYLNHLNDADFINIFYRDTKGITRLQKPDKVFLENSNIAYAINQGNTNIGNVRETFFSNHLKYKHLVNIPDQGDFMVDNHIVFEIGGKNKGRKQVRNLNFETYIASDEIEHGLKNKIPLWLFGFLY